jgi:hypothetical protein
VKRIGYIPLLLICLLQSGGMMFIYQFQQHEISEEVNLELDHGNLFLQTLTIPIGEFQKGRINEREFSRNGKMYDYKISLIHGSTIELLVFHDTKEESVLEKLKALVENTTKPGKDLPIKLRQLLSLTYTIPEMGGSLFTDRATKKMFFSFSDRVITLSCDFPSPPPELA